MSNSTNVYDDFMWRGMIFDATEGLREGLETGPVTAYIGFDPSAPSLHVGSLLPIMALARLQRHGHKPIAIVGGGTGLIGDPSGKTSERQLLTKEQVEYNLRKIREQLSHFLDFEAEGNPALIINNAEWLTTIPLIDFLRDVGKNFSVNSMLSRESVKRRMEQGITYTEFSYMLLQAYDFLVLNDRYGCTLQMGGSDQWGNILAGVDLIRRVRGEKGARAHGLVLPLLTDSKGAKFGKTESGTVWLNADPSLSDNYTSPYSFYQFFLNSEDASVITYLKFFTFLGESEIAEYEAKAASEPQKREAQRALAREVTKMLHGEEALANAERATRALFGGEGEERNDADLGEAFGYVPSTPLSAERLGGEGVSIVDLVFESGLATVVERDKQVPGKQKQVPSKSQARRLIQSGGIYLNYKRVSDVSARVRPEDAIGGGQFLLIGRGEKQYHLFKLVGEDQ